MTFKELFILIFLFLSIQGFSQKTLYIPTDFSNSASEFYNNISNTRKYESTNFVVYWGDKVGTNPSTYSDATLRFNPQSVADTLEYSFKRYITDLKFCSNASTTNLGKYKIIVMMMGTWNSTDSRLNDVFAQASSFDNTIGAMFCHPSATRDGGALSHEFAHTLQMMQHIQENPGNETAFSGYDWAGPFFETHANFMRGQVYPYFADIDGTLTRWIQTRHFMWSSSRHHYTCFHLLYYVQEKEGFDFTRRMWAESKFEEHPLETIKRLKGFTQEQLNDYLWGYAQRQPAFDYPIQWDSQIHTTSNFGMTMRSVYQTIKDNMPRYTSRQYTLLTKVTGTTDQYYTNNDWAPQDYGMNIIPLYPTCTATQKKVTIKFKGHTEVNTTQAGWRYGFVTTKSDGTISRYSPMYSTDGEASFTLDASTEVHLYLVVFSAPKVHINYNMDVGYPKQRRYPYELKIANANPEGYQTATDFRSWLKTNGHLHSNGGGWVSNNASVASTVYVGPYAIVRNGTISGTARIDDYAMVDGGTISGSAIIRGNACVYNATISSNAIVEGNAWMEGGSVSGTANIKGNAMLFAGDFGNAVVVGGDAEIGSCSSNGVYLQFPYWRNGRDNCDGKGATDTSNIDINATFTNFTATQMDFSVTPTCGATTTFSLTTSVVGSGTVSPTSGTFDKGTVQSLTASPATGYVFSGWSGNASGTTNPVSVTMDTNKVITATFTAIPTYILTTTVVGTGTVTPASGTYSSGTTQTITATPAKGFLFTGWSGDASGTTNPLSITITSNKKVTATFTAIPNDTLIYTILMNPLSDYTATTVKLDSARITKDFGLTSAQIASGFGTTIKYYAINPDGSFDSVSTANAPGHWFTNTETTTGYGTTSYIYSELTIATLLANIGQYPNTCKAGDSYTIRQTLVYTKSATVAAQVTLIFNIKINIKQAINLTQGWNLISINVRPADSTITTLFSGLNVLEIKTMDAFWRSGQNTAFNSLKVINPGNGYFVYMNAAGILNATGSAISTAGFPSATKAGWNIIGCPFQSNTAISTFFNTSNGLMLKGFNGYWIPNGTTNSLQNLEPGKGYFLKK